MEGKPSYSVRLLACLLLFGLVVSCASVTLYSVDLKYKPSKPGEAPGKEKKPAVAVAPFTDARQIDDKLIIGAVVQDDGSRIRIVPKYARPEDAVTSMVKDYLVRAGYPVLPAVRAADGKQGTLGEVQVGGEIDELEVLCRYSIPMKKYTAKVRLTVVLSNAKTGKMFYKVSAESNSSLEHYRFSEEMLEDQIDGVLSDAIEKLFEGDEMQRKINEAAGIAP